MTMEKDSIPLSKVMKVKIWLFLSNISWTPSMIHQVGFYFDAYFVSHSDLQNMTT